MTNSFYNHDDGYPAFNAQGASAAMRAQLDKIMAGFDKLPVLSVPNASKLVVVNAVGDALTALDNFTDTTTYNVTTSAHGLTPKLPGNTTTFLRGDGMWAAQGVSAMVSVPRTTNTIITGANVSNLIDYTGSANFTQTWAPPATLASGFYIWLRNSGTADIEMEAPSTVLTASTTSNSIAAGVTWTIGTGLTISIGDLAIFRRTADLYNQRITGVVSAYNSGSGVITITVLARVGSGTFTDWTVTTRPAAAGFDGLASFVMYPNEVRLVYINDTSTAIKSIVVKGFYRKAITSYVFIQPPGYSATEWDGVGGAGGAGSGRKGAAGSVRQGGSPGGTPGRTKRQFIGLPPGTGYPQTIGAAGTSGVGQSVNDTNGNNGTAGGNTSFSTLALAYGGVAGVGGTGNAANLYGTVSGSGSLSAGTAQYGTANTVSNGGNPSISIPTATQLARDVIGESGASAQSSAIGNSVLGGAASGSGDTTATTPLAGANSQYGVPGGGFGGWVTAADTLPATACRGGVTGSWSGTGVAGGVCGAVPTAGTNGAPNAGTDFDMGNSGSGGGSTGTLNISAQPGGNGSFPAGVAGGGGACSNGTGVSGAGGVSQPGQSLTWGIV